MTGPRTNLIRQDSLPAIRMNEKHVTVDGRRFVVTFNEAGEPRVIKERKLYAPGTPFEMIGNYPSWHHTHKLGSAKTMPQRIIAAAREAA